MTRYTATERDIRNKRANAYQDGGDLALSHMFDALSSGLTVREATGYTKDMIASAAQAIVDGTVGRKGREEARAAIRNKWNVKCEAHMGNTGHMILSAPVAKLNAGKGV